MERSEVLAQLLETGVVPIFRFKDTKPLMDTCQALVEGGINTFEITMGVPNALEAIRSLVATFGDKIVVGAGTVLDPETARAAILAGAEYIVAPGLNVEVIELCRRYSKVVLPGALTPTEILAAWEAGADMVKVFPVRAFGPAYIKDILAPLPQVKLVAVGGVNTENAADFIRAGAVAVGMGSELLDKKLIAEGRYAELTRRARDLTDSIKAARVAH